MRRRKAVWVLLRPRKPVVCEGDVGADENIAFQTDAIPKITARVDGHAIAQNDIIFNKAMNTDIDLYIDLCAGEDNYRLPYS